MQQFWKMDDPTAKLLYYIHTCAAVKYLLMILIND